MPTLQTGTRSRQRTIRLTDEQLEKLGFDPEEKPVKLGCGTQACAYLPHPNSDSVVKVTKDSRDALAAYILSKLPGGVPKWAVPVRAVYRLPNSTFVIITAKADPLPEELGEAIDEIFNYAAEDEEVLDFWPEEYEEEKARLKREHAKGEDTKIANIALDAVNEAVTGFRNLGLDWADFHSGNWMMYNGRPVVVDFGMSANIDEPPVDELRELANSPLKSIPVLRF